MAVPLDRKFVNDIPALDPKWKSDVRFVRYTPLPLSTGDNASIEEWGETLSFIDEDLHWLLTLPHDRFWCQVVFEETVMQCVDSYLRYAPRYYDVHTVPSEYAELHAQVHRKVFMVCVRLATHKESKDCHITPSVFGDILYQNFIFDIPKLMDLCVLYGEGNGPLLSKMITNIFLHQPGYESDLQSVVPTILQVFSSIHKKCVDEQTGSPQKLSATRRRSVLEAMSDGDFQDVVFYLLDTSFTLRYFLDVYPPASIAFAQEEFPVKLAGFYESTVGSLLDAINARTWQTDGLDAFLKSKLHIAQINLLKAFRTVVFHACLQPLLDTTSNEQAERLIEEYFNLVSNCIAERRFLGHLESLYPFREDEELMTQTEYALDETRLQFLQEGIQEAYAAHGKTSRKRKPKKKHFSGLCSREAETPDRDEDEAEYGAEAAGASAPAVSEVELQSMLAAVKDLLPDLGDGFIELCFEELGYSVETVINALLEKRLPETLLNADRSMKRTPPQHSGYVDPMSLAQEESLLRRRKNIYDNDEFDEFSTTVDKSRVHVGKADKLGNVSEFLSDKSAIRAARARYEAYSVGVMVEDVEEGGGDYDDEYDDTYDANEVGADDAGSADELTTRRPFTTPRILGRHDRRERMESSSSEDSSEEGRKRDQFIEDPSVVRERLAQRYAHKQARMNRKPAQPRNFDVKGAPKGEGQSSQVLRNRANKEKHKASRVNHNRKAMSDRKRRVP